MGLLTDNKLDIANISWNDAFGDPQEISILDYGMCERLFGDYNDKDEFLPRAKYLSNRLISMLPQPADRLINLIYRYHYLRDKLPYTQKHEMLDEFLEYFCPCNGGFEFDTDMSKLVNNISLVVEASHGRLVRIRMNGLMFVQEPGGGILHMAFRINASSHPEQYDPWSSRIMNVFYKFAL